MLSLYLTSAPPSSQIFGLTLLLTSISSRVQCLLADLEEETSNLTKRQPL